VARVYATPDDVVDWLGDYPPSNVDTLITRASLVVDELLVGVRYCTDTTTGLPTDTTVIGALRDAVCAQVAWWISATYTQGQLGAKDGWDRMDRAVRPDPIPPTRTHPGRAEIAPDTIRALNVAGLSPAHVMDPGYWYPWVPNS
jgi:hypothetical protein